MIVSWRKLLELLEGPQPEPRELFDRLTFAGIEGEALWSVHDRLRNVVAARVARVETIEGKKVRRVTIEAADGQHVVACGDTTVTEGETVAWARPGAVVGGIAITPRTVAGIDSEGMLASALELGVGGDGGGVWRIEGAPGQPLPELVDNDWLLEFGLTPNRGDAFSHLGLAREAAVLFDGQVRIPQVPETTATADGVQIRLDDADCPYYVGLLIELDDRPQRTPPAIEQLLGRCGMRALDPVVDLTNYVMLELGQPLHAFDADKIVGGVTVRAAREGETIALLDETERTLLGGELVIADDAGPIALAGVMGGSRTEVDGDTRRVLLESAYFAPTRVSRGRRPHKLSTEASMRFERGVDPAGVDRAAARFLGLLQQIAPARLTGRTATGAPATMNRTVAWDPDAARRLLGHLPEPDVCEQILTRLGLTDAGNGLRTVPTWRFDIERNEDLAEEIARITGYDQFTPTLPAAPVVARIDDGFYGLRSRVMDTLVAAGLLQGVHYSFGPAVEGAVPLANPLGEQTAALRTELWPGLCAVAAHNHRHGESDVRLFEIGRVFHERDARVIEQWRLGLILTGRRHPDYWDDDAPVDLFDVRGLIEQVLCDLGLPDTALEARPEAAHPELHPGKAARLLLGGTECGWLGELEPDAAQQRDLQPPVVGAELDLEVLATLLEQRQTPRFCALPRFPASQRDLAFVLQRTTPSADVLLTIRDTAGELLEAVHVFDVYQGAGLGDSERSVAFRLRFRAPDRTLEQDEIDAAVERVVAAVQQRFGARLR